MECPNCELRQRQFYCESCLRQQLDSQSGRKPDRAYQERQGFGALVPRAPETDGDEPSGSCPSQSPASSVLTFRLQTQHAAAESRQRRAHRGGPLTSLVDPARLRRAELETPKERVQEIWGGVNHDWAQNQQLRKRIQTLRNFSLSTRRRTLAIATCTFLHTHPSTPSTSASPPHPPISSRRVPYPPAARRSPSHPIRPVPPSLTRRPYHALSRPPPALSAPDSSPPPPLKLPARRSPSRPPRRRATPVRPRSLAPTPRARHRRCPAVVPAALHTAPRPRPAVSIPSPGRLTRCRRS
ncbi:hypothetical protein OH77DRAFT_666612 [Trametes cingulata]|nr:hypothetical protein OH77DRAFT_666612 [Trametes cingulata]